MIPTPDFHFGKPELPQFVHEIEAGSDKSICPVGLNPGALNNGSDVHEPKYYFKPPNSHWLHSSEIISFGKQINKPCQTTQQFCACLFYLLFLPFPLTLYSAPYASRGEWGQLTGMAVIAILPISAVVGQNEHFLNSKSRCETWQQQQIPL